MTLPEPPRYPGGNPDDYELMYYHNQTKNNETFVDCTFWQKNHTLRGNSDFVITSDFL